MSISSPTRSKLKGREESRSPLLNLPEEVHEEIFLKVPAKSILVSKCVCKLFYNLLSKPSFIKNHVNRSVLSKANPKILFSQSSGVNPPMIYSIPIDYLSISSPQPLDGAVPINYPFDSTRIHLSNLLGSCDGLIFSTIVSIDTTDIFIVETKFWVLNPLTREFKEFQMPEKCYGNLTCGGGFGYDSKIDDYKLVLVSDYEKGSCCKVYVCTVKSGSWRSSSIQGTVNLSFRNGREYRGRGVFFNGCLHWLASIDTHGTSSEVIFSYNISNEIVVNMPLPENIIPPTDYTGDVYKNVGVWGECIGIAIFWDPVRIDVWVMQEYGVKESWIRKYTTTQLPLPSLEIIFWRPLWCFDNGEILIDTGGKQLLLYDPTTQRFRSVVVSDFGMGNCQESYVESIVSLGSGTYMEKLITNEIVKNLD